MRCSECGTEIDSQTIFCPNCGTVIAQQTLVGISEADPSRVLCNRYIILSVLGRGGMGTVYLSKDVQLDVIVAIKLLPQEILSDLRAVEWMKEETRLARDLRHDNIAAVYNFETDTAKQAAFIVMEFINGVDLHNLLARTARNRLSAEIVAHILKGCAKALDYAHSKRVIHRDVKPKNIMVRKDGIVKVTDFGIAKRLRDTMSKISQTVVAGTPAYMAPEQLEGKSVDHRADIYSLGATVYELLVGEPPFCGSSVELMYQILNVPVPPIKSDVFGGDEEKARRATEVLKKCLAKHPEERYATAEDFFNAFCNATSVQTEIPQQLEKSEVLSPLGMAVTDALLTHRQTISQQTPPAGPLASATPRTPFETPTVPKPQSEVPAAAAVRPPETVKPPPQKKKSLTKIIAISAILFLLSLLPIGLTFLHKKKPEPTETIPSLAIAEFIVEGEIGRTSGTALANTVADKIKGNDYKIIKPLELKGILSSLGLTISQLNDCQAAKRLYTERQIRYLILCSVIKGAAYEIEGRMIDLKDGSVKQEYRVFVETTRDVERTAETLGEILTLDNTHKKIYFLLKEAWRETDYEKAINKFNEARKLDEKDESVLKFQEQLTDSIVKEALNKCSDKNYAEALRLLNIAKEFNPSAQSVKELPDKLFSDILAHAREAADRKSYDEAIRTVKEALKFKPGDEVANKLLKTLKDEFEKNVKFVELMMAARKALDEERYDEAIRTAEDALKIKPEDDETKEIINRARTTKRIREARERIDETQKEVPAARVLLEQAEVTLARMKELFEKNLITKGEFEKAKESYRVAKERAENAATAAAKALVDAMKIAQEVLKENPDNAEAKALLRKAMGEENEWERFKKLTTLEGHTEVILSVAYSPDGKLLASCGMDKTVRLWDTQTGKEVKKVEGSQAEFYSVAFSPDSKLLATGSGSEDHTVTIWNIEAGETVHSFELEEGESIFSVAFSPDGKLIAAGGSNNKIHIWSLETGELLKTLEQHTDSVSSVAFSPNGNLLASASMDKTVLLWNPQMGEVVRKLEENTEPKTEIKFSPDGSLLATAGNGKTIRIWEVESGKLAQKLDGEAETVYGLAFSPDGKILASSGDNGKLLIWDVKTGKLLKTLEGHSGTIYTLASRPDGKTIASAGDDKKVIIWGLEGAIQQTQEKKKTKTEYEKIRTLEGHTEGIYAIAVSSDGKLLASGSWDKTVRIWDISTGNLICKLEGHKDAIFAVAFSPDSKTVASASSDKTVKLWNAYTGELLKTLEGFSEPMWTVAYSPDGTLLATAGLGKSITLFDAQSGAPLGTLDGHTEGVFSVAFSPNGKLLLSTSADKTIRLWDVKAKKLLRTFEGHTEYVLSGAFSPDGKLVASAGTDKTIRVWNVETGELVHILEGHTNNLRQLLFAPNGKTLISSSEDKTVKIWDVETGKCLKTLEGHTDTVYSVAISPNGRLLFSAGADKTIVVWSIPEGVIGRGPVTGEAGFEKLMVLEGHTDSIYAVAFSPDGKLLASASNDATVKLWDSTTGECKHTLERHTGAVYSLAFSPDGRFLASGDKDGTIWLWNAQTGEVINSLQGHTNAINSLMFSPDSKLLASASWDNTARIWDVESEECLQKLTEHKNYVVSLSFSPDGKILATASYDKTVRIWEVKTGKLLRTLIGHTDFVGAVTFSPDGKLLASSSKDNTVRLWDPQTGKCLQTLKGHTSPVMPLSFSPDGKLLASASDDKTARIWNPQTGQQIHKLEGHTRTVSAIQFSPNGRALASGSVDNTVRVWDTNTGKLLCLLESHTNVISSLSFSPNEPVLASGSLDGTIVLWKIPEEYSTKKETPSSEGR